MQHPFSPITPLSVAAVSAGGALGALARWALTGGQPTGAGFPWRTLAVNVCGCLLIGVLMVIVVELRPGWPLLRPFLGVGVLGGYTTFSAYVVEVGELLVADALRTALAYLVSTPVLAVLATFAGVRMARRALDLRGGSGAQGRPLGQGPGPR